MTRSNDPLEERQQSRLRRRIVLLPVLLLILLASLTWPLHQALSIHKQTSSELVTTGTWRSHPYDLVYMVAFSSPQRPDGPLVAYRAPASDLRATVPVVAVARDNGNNEPAQTPLFFPSPDGHYLALQTPLGSGLSANLNGAALGIFSTDGRTRKLLVPQGAAENDQPVWSADGRVLYYHTGTFTEQTPGVASFQSQKRPIVVKGSEEIRRVDLGGRATLLWSQPLSTSSLRLIGVDRNGDLILSVARPKQPVTLWRLPGNARSMQTPKLLMTLPADILPGNIQGIGSDGLSVNCLRVLQWQPLHTTQVQIAFNGQVTGAVQPLFATNQAGISALARSADGQVQVMAQVTAMRADLAAQGLPDVPQQEKLVVADPAFAASQSLSLPPGGQVVQAFWTSHLSSQQVKAVSTGVMQQAFALPDTTEQSGNASVFQQDAWMLKAHAGLLSDSPALPPMCYGYCPHGLVNPPHVSAAIMHGVAYTESNWHQFNTSNYQVDGEPGGAPVESFDGGWGEYQQTWGMPPQCQNINNCRSDYQRVENDQAYNTGVGAASLISAWNATAGIISPNDPNDPSKANDWFFAVWAYNGLYGNNPNDIPSNLYAHWYPGAPFRSIYEEYVWYFAAHPQFSSNGWTDNYLPSLGPSQLPPQSDFQDTSDDFASCVFCTIPDWTAGNFDRDWVGQGVRNATTTKLFRQTYQKEGGERTVGLPVDESGDGAGIHSWGQGWTQNMDGGSSQAGALMMAKHTTNVFWVYGDVWTRYQKDQGAHGCHGYPISNLTSATASQPGLDTYYIQLFQNGLIIWDATKGRVTEDACPPTS